MVRLRRFQSSVMPDVRVGRVRPTLHLPDRGYCYVGIIVVRGAGGKSVWRVMVNGELEAGCARHPRAGTARWVLTPRSEGVASLYCSRCDYALPWHQERRPGLAWAEHTSRTYHPEVSVLEDHVWADEVESIVKTVINGRI